MKIKFNTYWRMAVRTFVGFLLLKWFKTYEMKKILFILMMPVLCFGQKNAEYYKDEGMRCFFCDNYEGAIENYTKSIENRMDLYGSRGNAKLRLENYYGAIDDFNKAIELKPDYVNAYLNRANLKEKLGKPFCSDYRKACDLGHSDACEWYNNQCR